MKTGAVDPNQNEVADTKRIKGFRNILSIVLIVLLLLSALVMARILFWAAEPTNVLDIKNAPVPVRTIREHPTADGVVILKIDYCKNNDSEGKVRTSFVSSSREIFLPQSEDKQAATCTVAELPILIPHDTPADTYRVKFRVEYNLNPVKSQVVEEFESLPFVVAE